MKTVWKWVIGIVIVLVIAALVVGGVFLLRYRLGNFVSIARGNPPALRVPRNNTAPGPKFMMPYGDNYPRGYTMRGPGMMGFGGFYLLGGLFSALIWLGFMALVVLGIIWLVRSLRRPMTYTAPVGMAPSAPQVPPSPMNASHPCSKCGEPVMEGMKFCPNCGRKQ